MKIKASHSFFLLFSLMLCGNLSAAVPEIKRTVKETLISRIALHDMYNNTYTISNNQRRIAFRIRKDKQLIAVVDTLAGKPYDDVQTPVFSPDGKHFVYTARTGPHWMIIMDHQQKVKLDSGSTVRFIRFSTDNKQLLYILNDGLHDYMVLDGKKSKPYDAINENSVTLSADGSKLAYSVTLQKKQLNIFDGVAGPAFDLIGFPVISSDGKQFAYWAIADKSSYVILDNIKSKAFEAVGTLAFSKDGKHLLYDVRQDGKHFIVKDSVNSEMHEYLHSYVLSPDGSRLAYGITQAGDKHGFNEYVVMGDKKEGPYEQVMIRSLQFSPDGKELTYGAQLPNLVSSNGVETEVDGYEWYVVRNFIPQTRYNMLQGTIVYSPDSKHLAYGAEKYIKRMVVEDGKESSAYDDVYFMAYSPDSKHLLYSVMLDNKVHVVIDEIKGRAYDDIPGQKEILFDSDNSFHYLAIKGDAVYLVEEKIE